MITVDSATPHITTTPITVRVSWPGPAEATSGTAPMTVVKAVIMIGRSRLEAPCATASSNNRSVKRTCWHSGLMVGAAGDWCRGRLADQAFESGAAQGKAGDLVGALKVSTFDHGIDEKTATERVGSVVRVFDLRDGVEETILRIDGGFDTGKGAVPLTVVVV